MAHLSTVLKKFEDDTKLGRVIKSQADRDALQNCIYMLAERAQTWEREFNVSKCKVMHLGHRNPGYTHSMNGAQLGTTTEERDIGVTMSSNLRPSAQYNKVSRTASAVLTQITRAFHYRDRNTFISLYKQYVRPHLEFAVQAWNPWTHQDKETLETICRRAVGMVLGLKGRTYEKRLEELKMTTLEERRHQADMLQVYKIITRKDNVDSACWFKMAAK
jgi:ribonuclease P/MRP protein subunit RPP40